MMPYLQPNVVFVRRFDITFLKLLLNGSLIFMAMVILSSGEDILSECMIKGRLPDNVVPIHYNISLRPFIYTSTFIHEGGRNHRLISILQNNESVADKARYKGKKYYYHIFFYGYLHVNINILRATRLLILHSENMYIDEEITKLIAENGMVYYPSNHLYEKDFLILNFTDELSSGYYSLTVKFVGNIPNNTLEGFFIISYRSSYSKLLTTITNLHPIGARRVFPCWDEPALKATFDISIKHDLRHIALSNMPEIEESNDSLMKWARFHTTPEISTYQVAIILTNTKVFHKIKIGRVTNKWYRFFVPYMNESDLSYLSFAQNVSTKVLSYLDIEWGSYINIPELQQILIPPFQTENAFLKTGIDSCGIIIYSDKDIIYIESDSVLWKMEVIRSVTFRIVRQLFYNMVSPSWWSYMWLNEALAQFLGIHIIDEIYPELRFMDLFVVQDQQESLRWDSGFFELSVEIEGFKSDQIKNLFSSRHYAFLLRRRAPVLIRMLQHIVDIRELKMGIRTYFDKHSFSSATSDDLWDAIQFTVDGISDSNNKILGLKRVMKSWINKNSYPVVNVKQHFPDNILIKTNCPHVDESNLSMGWIPLTYTTQTNLNFDNTSPKHWLNTVSPLIFPNETGWIIVNLQQAGYYRVNYCSENWWKIVNFLDSNEYSKIHVLNRAQIIDDAYHFLVLGEMKFTIFLKLMKYLRRETDYVVWYSMFKILEDISVTFPLMKMRQPIAIIKVHMRNILGRLFKNIGYNVQPGESDLTKCLRQEASKWASILGDSRYIKRAVETLQIELNQFKQKWLSDCKIWTWSKRLLQNNIDSNIIVDYIILNHIDFAEEVRNVSAVCAFGKENSFDSILYIIKMCANNKNLLQHLLNHYFKILFRHPMHFSARYSLMASIINHVYSKIHLDMISNKLPAIFEYQEHLLPGIQRRIDGRINRYMRTSAKFLFTA